MFKIILIAAGIAFVMWKYVHIDLGIALEITAFGQDFTWQGSI